MSKKYRKMVIKNAEPGDEDNGDIVIIIPPPPPRDGGNNGNGPPGPDDGNFPVGGGDDEEDEEKEGVKYTPSGSSATGIQEPWELPPSEEHMSRARAETIRKRTAKKIREGEFGRRTGKSTGPLEWAEAELASKVNWRDELRSSVTAAIAYISGQMDYSRRKFGRRQLSSEFILPGLIGTVPQVAVVLDVSGSMFAALRYGDSSQKAGAEYKYNVLDRAIAELDSILKYAGITEGVQVFSTDVEVKWASKVFRVNQIAVPETGGGTDIGVGMLAAYHARPRPNIMVVLTDGITPWPDTPPPGVKVIVGIVGATKEELENCEWKVPAWAKVIYITE